MNSDQSEYDIVTDVTLLVKVQILVVVTAMFLLGDTQCSVIGGQSNFQSHIQKAPDTVTCGGCLRGRGHNS